MAIELSASILSANFASLGEDVQRLITAGVDSIHFDVMDMNYVPNLTVGPVVLEALAPYLSDIPVHAHLMVTKVAGLINPLVAAGAASITWHLNHGEDDLVLVDMVKAAGCQVGIALNPDEDISLLLPYLPIIDRVLVMAVYPGFAGQSFIDASIDRLAAVAKLIVEQNLSCVLEVDGGVKLENCQSILATGVDSIVVGSGLMIDSNYKNTVDKFKLLFGLET